MNESMSFDTAAAISDSGHLLDPEIVGQPIQFSSLPRVRTALVTAAHRPSALDAKQVPKELILFKGTPIIIFCLNHLALAGVSEIILVVAKNGERVAKAVLGWAKSPGIGNSVRLHIVLMPTCFCHASSIVAARRLLPQEFLLVTGDHVFDPRLVHRLASIRLAAVDAGCVLVDSDIRIRSSGVADTGVYVRCTDGGRIGAIGRAAEIPSAMRNGIEAGMFLIRKELVETLIDLSTIGPYFTLASALAVKAREGRLCCEKVQGLPWLCFETLAQLQAASQFRYPSELSATLREHVDEQSSIPVGEIIDGIVEVTEQTASAQEGLQRVVTIRPIKEAQRVGSAGSFRGAAQEEEEDDDDEEDDDEMDHAIGKRRRNSYGE